MSKVTARPGPSPYAREPRFLVVTNGERKILLPKKTLLDTTLEEALDIVSPYYTGIPRASLVLKTDQLEECEGELIELTRESWGFALPFLKGVTVCESREARASVRNVPATSHRLPSPSSSSEPSHSPVLPSPSFIVATTSPVQSRSLPQAPVLRAPIDMPKIEKERNQKDVEYKVFITSPDGDEPYRFTVSPLTAVPKLIKHFAAIRGLQCSEFSLWHGEKEVRLGSVSSHGLRDGDQLRCVLGRR
ncbi:hypothetical protein CYLTODRAFT_446515 [Cylindrobasidium torrendii FP15055 ss-10]|uniref:Ubiquitin-like domain-containing protein n=1 Tax=Cylindrobasidium torrendii FP15055 ss-10 TaxID=1314674 RepID=A0A0D7B244_9AGAR|nr:hypothetical protein CYLTODRAFT_446515 [Cylindrobasidium torrendii FP15055 ss-10]